MQDAETQRRLAEQLSALRQQFADLITSYYYYVLYNKKKSFSGQSIPKKLIYKQSQSWKNALRGVQDAEAQRRVAEQLSALRQQFAEWESSDSVRRNLAALDASGQRSASDDRTRAALNEQLDTLEGQVCNEQ